ncbi:TetR/AcrR family transcriptional regulator [Lentibacillus sp. Marseille-P4043]|uniref:TetR/AcrR family transcriptional regulator n=1 Tax=Lentibacillus sp. Marseille-P4043 TaxID=2040293 RepID=UPI000D0BE872|nr:TetR-like C-terminal domain-containing protein [Lentibacillus sp. Marseille-P4043]
MSKNKDKLDPRIIRTRQLLRNAFIELLQEMDIEKISVNSLTKRAGVNRVTFYLHYQDITDMMEKLADDMIVDISNVLDQATIIQQPTEKLDWEKMMAEFLEHIAEDANFYKTILSTKGIPIFRNRLLMLLEDRIIYGVERRGSDSRIHKAGIQKDILIWYDSAALIGVIIAWLRNDMPYTPLYLAKQFYLIHNRK